MSSYLAPDLRNIILSPNVIRCDGSIVNVQTSIHIDYFLLGNKTLSIDPISCILNSYHVDIVLFIRVGIGPQMSLI